MTEFLTLRQQQIAKAAAPVFFAHGFAGTTMGMIAQAAGLSRQGLYLAFPDKARVFEAMVRTLNDELMAQIERAFADLPDVGARIGLACESWLSAIHELTSAAPVSRDLDNLDVPVTREVYDRFVDLIARLLEDVPAPGASQADRRELATILVFAIRGFGAVAPDGKALKRMASRQIAMVIATLSGNARAFPHEASACQ